MGFSVKSLHFSSRGVGVDWGFKYCAFCGGGLKEVCANISGFVKSKDEGEAIVEAIDGAFLDYRESEPNWIQVKISACKKCEHRLDALHNATKENNNRISLDMLSK